MSARVFIHPTCAPGTPRYQLMQDALVAHGFVMETLALHQQPGKRYEHELCRLVEATPEKFVLERFDGTRFERPIPRPEAA